MLSEAEQIMVDREREQLLARLPAAPVMSHTQWSRWHADLQAVDSERLASGRSTPEQVQQENSFWSLDEARQFRVINFVEMMSSYH